MANNNGKVFVDRARTKTALDVQSLDECDAYIRRIAQNIFELNQIKQPSHRERQALKMRDIALTQLKQRRTQLGA